jgi:hypothetical protein
MSTLQIVNLTGTSVVTFFYDETSVDVQALREKLRLSFGLPNLHVESGFGRALRTGYEIFAALTRRESSDEIYILVTGWSGPDALYNARASGTPIDVTLR